MDFQLCTDQTTIVCSPLASFSFPWCIHIFLLYFMQLRNYLLIRTKSFLNFSLVFMVVKLTRNDILYSMFLHAFYIWWNQRHCLLYSMFYMKHMFWRYLQQAIISKSYGCLLNLGWLDMQNVMSRISLLRFNFCFPNWSN